MKTPSLPALLLAALISIPSAYAVPAVTGDLILGFKASGGMGSDVNLEVNLGPAADFYGAAAGSTAILTKLSVQDLVDTYGNDWNTRSDLSWGIVGTTGFAAVGSAPARTIWASRAEATSGTASPSWPTGSTFTLNIPIGAMLSLYTGAPGSLDRFGATTNSTSSSKVTASESGSWSAQEGFTPGVSFRYFNPTVMQPIAPFTAVNSSYDGTAYNVLDLWELRPGAAGGPGTLVGGFGVNSAGKLVFSKDVSKFGPATTPVELGQPTITYSGTGSATITLAGAPNGNYVLERSTTMAAASWTILFTQSPVSGVLSYIDPAPPAGRGFYQIRKL